MHNKGALRAGNFSSVRSEQTKGGRESGKRYPKWRSRTDGSPRKGSVGSGLVSINCRVQAVLERGGSAVPLTWKGNPRTSG